MPDIAKDKNKTAGLPEDDEELMSELEGDLEEEESNASGWQRRRRRRRAPPADCGSRRRGTNLTCQQ